MNQETNTDKSLILVVDDNPDNLILLHAMLKDEYRPKVVKRGERALEIARSASPPDLILLDIMMPEMDGYEVCRRLKLDAKTREIPVIFLTAKSSDEDEKFGLDLGAVDFIIKPVNPYIVRARVKNQIELKKKSDLLKRKNAMSERELEMARDVMAHMILGSSVPLPQVKLWIQPAATLGGDLLLTQQYNQEIEYVLQADAMGHGLSAAFPLVPLVWIFSNMAGAGNSIAQIAQEMNDKLSQLLPVGNFVAVTLVSIDRKNRQLSLWNGGNPQAMLTDKNGNLLCQFKSRNMALAILRGVDFEAIPETVQWREECLLTLYSDGLDDALNPDGETFGLERIKATLGRTDPHQVLKDELTAHLDGYDSIDDISLVSIQLT